MPRWSRTEEEYLREHAGEGAKAVADALGRTVPSVQVKASRMGVTLFKRWHCPRCGRWVYAPLAKWSGWCRKCSIDESADTAAEKNRRIRRDIEEERRLAKDAERRRQAIYSDTNRKKMELRRLRESRKRNEKSGGKKDAK